MGLIIGVGNNKPTFPYTQYYGIEKDLSVAGTSCKRIGLEELHRQLPIQSKMRRCLLPDNGKVSQYLHAANSDLTDTGMAADLTGASGQSMVEIPDYYAKFELEGTIFRALFSEYPLPGFHLIPKHYISAWEATMDRTTQTLASVVNNTAQYRGGGNNAARDDAENTDLGKPATSISLTNFRAYAAKRGEGWSDYLYSAHKSLYWLYVCEYADFNCQLAYNPDLDATGFHQGGLGPGVTTLDSNKWSAFNGYYPVIPCGVTRSLGNSTGVVQYNMPASYDAAGKVVEVPSYRGIENPFGHIWKWVDGILCNIQSEAAGGKSIVYTSPEFDPDKLASAITADFTARGEMSRSSGWVKELLLGEYGEIMPKTIGGGSNTHVGDYFYTSIPENGESTRGVLFGGYSHFGASAGFASANTYYAPSHTYASFGSRLCFTPKREATN